VPAGGSGFAVVVVGVVDFVVVAAGVLAVVDVDVDVDVDVEGTALVL
jgi:hypothetical protein